MRFTALAVVILALGIVVGFALAGGPSGGPASAVPKCPPTSSSPNCTTPTPVPTSTPVPNPTLAQTFLNPSPDPSDRFGQSVASIGSNVIVGAPGDSNAGAVYVFDGANGSILLTIPNPDTGAASNPQFGFSVAAVGGNILVGAPSYDIPTAGRIGRAVLFDGTTGDLLLTIPNPTPIVAENFGFSVAAMGEDLLVGAASDVVDGIIGAGSAYVFDGITGSLLLTIPNPDPAQHDKFGWSVAGVGATSSSAYPKTTPAQYRRLVLSTSSMVLPATSCVPSKTLTPRQTPSGSRLQG